MKSLLLVPLLIWVFAGCRPGRAGGDLPAFRKVDASTIWVRDGAGYPVGRLESKRVPITVELSGRVAIPDKNITLISSRVQGRLGSLTATVGDTVAAGQVIGTIWSPDLVTAAQELGLARSSGSAEQLALALSKLKALELRPEDAVPGRETFPVRARSGGVVLERKVSAGSAVQPGDAILSLGKLGSYQFQGELTPDLGGRIRPGMEVRFDEAPDALARVETVSPVADPVTRLIKVRVRFDQFPKSLLTQDTLLKSRVVLRTDQAQLAPISALLKLADGDYVFTRVADGGARPEGASQVFRRVKIRVLSKDATSFSPEGVPPGVEILSENVLNLNDAWDSVD